MSGILKYDRANIELRRGKVLELTSKGIPQAEIAKTLNVSNATVSVDMQYIMCKAQENLKTHLEERIPVQYEKVSNGLNQVLRLQWQIVESTEDEKIKLNALGLISTTYKYLLELSTDQSTLKHVYQYVNKVMEDNKRKVEPQELQEQIQEEEQEQEQVEEKEVIVSS